MKITKIEVDRFGVWRQLALPVSGRGLTVFYGPNEAGKTTLWRFIRSIPFPKSGKFSRTICALKNSSCCGKTIASEIR